MDQSKRVVISHPTGNANVRAAVEALYRGSTLHSYHTSVSCFRGGLLYLLSIFVPFRDFRRRLLNKHLRDYTHTYPVMELGRMFSKKLGIKSWLLYERGRFCIDRVYHTIDHNVASYIKHHISELDAVYCYEDCAFETFIQAKIWSKKRIYDLPIGYWRRMHQLLEAERIARPEWAVTLDGLSDSEEKLHRKDIELALADKIYVASSFTKRSLDDYPSQLADIEVIPYGFPPAADNRTFTPFEGRKVKALFVGSLSQRKGIANIFEALEGLYDKVELTVVGSGEIEHCEVLRTALQRVRHIPALPHNEILQLMSTQDILLFPSLFEGFGLVITEAMSQGTPVITTDRGCGPDIITDGVDGWIVEAGSTVALRNQILQLLSNPYKITEAGKRAIERAKRRPWSLYERELSESISNYLRDV